MRIMVLDLIHGLGVTTVCHTIASEMVLLCVFHLVLGSWTVDFVHEQVCWPSNERNIARLSAEVTHNHPEGIKGDLATSDAIFMCRYYFGGYSADYGQPINDNPKECKDGSRIILRRNMDMIYLKL